jgi:hypothetical protein
VLSWFCSCLALLYHPWQNAFGVTVGRTTTLAFGASLLGSALTLLVYATRFDCLQRAFSAFLLVAGLLFLAHGTGFLHKAIVQVLAFWGTRRPAIAVISDLPLSAEMGTSAWITPEMTPQTWRNKLSAEARRQHIKAEIRLIRTDTKWFAYWAHRYNVILNPLGSVYPEVNVKELTTWNTLSSYILQGGTVVSLSDIPFYYTYDKRKGIRYDLSKRAYHYIPLRYRQQGTFFELDTGTYRPISPFAETPFLRETRLEVINTEDKTGSPLTLTLKVRTPPFPDRIDHLQDVSVNRAFLLGTKQAPSAKLGNVNTIVDAILFGDSYYTPLCYIQYGDGRFLVSAFFLDGDAQSRDARDTVFDLIAKLTVQETRRSFIEYKEKARKSASIASELAEYVAKALSMSYPLKDLK